MDRTGIFISGGGLAGLIAAAAFGQAGFDVVVADPAPPVGSADEDGSDLRSTAYLRPAQGLIDRAGLWSELEPHATPLETLEAVDSVGWPPEIRETRPFQSEETGASPFGWNILNWRARSVLTEKIAALPNVDLRLGVGFRGLLQRETEALVTLSDGARLRARLAIAADGRNSPLREAAGIGADLTRYGQKALAFTTTHTLPHANISTEIYNEGGAFTLVPMPDVDGKPASAVVWMNTDTKARVLMEMDTATFEEQLTLRSCGLRGPMQLASPRRSWPVVTQRAHALAAERVAIIAEAAHVLPPIGAQGLNTSLQDVMSLLRLAEDAPDRLGDQDMLRAYSKARDKDIAARAKAIDLFNRVCKSGARPVQDLRLAGLWAVHGIAPLRKSVMRAGLGSE